MDLSGFREQYPEFDSVADSIISAQLALFPILYAGYYGDLTDYLTGLFVAHQVYVKSKRGGGPVQAMTNRAVGDVSTGFAQSSGAEMAQDFASSKYGLEFSRLIRMFGMGPMITSNTVQLVG